ncbi:DNA repair protein RadA [Patescibacteria group bacterium]
MKHRSVFICQQCSFEAPQWYGKCPNCDSWSSLVETVKDGNRGKSKAKREGSGVVERLSAVKHIEKERMKSGFGEFDRVVGGGIVTGSVVLLAGDPGIGKSTLLLHVLGKNGGFYVSAEESAEQVKLRAKRLGISGETIHISAQTSLETILSQLETWKRNQKKRGEQLVVIDSIQSLSADDLSGMAGSVGQIRRCGEVLTRYAKSHGVAMIIIGHVTKQGTIAGPKILEHMVDTVLYLEGERFANARILRTFKNRFGAVEEVGIFEMSDAGIKEVSNPSALFLENRAQNVPGSVVTVVMEGTRPVVLELQALVVPTQLAIPRRVVNGIDFNRLQLIIAVLQKHLNLPLGSSDIFVNVSGGFKIQEPAADLAVAIAIISSFKNSVIDENTAVFGELGLLGEVRTIGSGERRIKEAKRLGYSTVISPKLVKNIKQASMKLS